MSFRRAACAEWPRIMCPAPGFMPPKVDEALVKERTVHVALRSACDQQDGLTRALAGISAVYRDVDWRLCEPIVNQRVANAVQEIRPTLIWMQLQKGGVLTPEHIRWMRANSDPRCVIVNWDGDQHYEPGNEMRRWFVELGRECDLSLVVNTRHPYQYAEMGVKHPGFLGVGTDEEVWCPKESFPGLSVPEVVCLANFWRMISYDNRNSLFQAMASTYRHRFAVYGEGWQHQREIQYRPYLKNHEEGYVYSAAKCALSISIRNDLPRYSSNRLFYALSSGAVVLVERFPDIEGLGVEDGKNCLVWTGWDGLKVAVDEVLSTYESDALRWQTMRHQARALGIEHGWAAHMLEMLAMVYAVRQERGWAY